MVSLLEKKLISNPFGMYVHVLLLKIPKEGSRTVPTRKNLDYSCVKSFWDIYVDSKNSDSKNYILRFYL